MDLRLKDRSLIRVQIVKSEHVTNMGEQNLQTPDRSGLTAQGFTKRIRWIDHTQGFLRIGRWISASDGCTP
jgi:hypothetical protein